eukprot:TRINITY_DN3754_c0_g1_i2.p1 TRINITY_DN3754_c0_g1~~TRINITY_DN3754_c0_g1_i2.p1  ORF type:complete len:785 (+),score=147.02 TRINITY_DN3754_c0_g1_i2:144-2498(+)
MEEGGGGRSRRVDGPREGSPNVSRPSWSYEPGSAVGSPMAAVQGWGRTRNAHIEGRASYGGRDLHDRGEGNTTTPNHGANASPVASRTTPKYGSVTKLTNILRGGVPEDRAPMWGGDAAGGTDDLCRQDVMSAGSPSSVEYERRMCALERKVAMLEEAKVETQTERTSLEDLRRDLEEQIGEVVDLVVGVKADVEVVVATQAEADKKAQGADVRLSRVEETNAKQWETGRSLRTQLSTLQEDVALLQKTNQDKTLHRKTTELEAQLNDLKTQQQRWSDDLQSLETRLKELVEANQARAREAQQNEERSRVLMGDMLDLIIALYSRIDNQASALSDCGPQGAVERRLADTREAVLAARPGDHESTALEETCKGVDARVRRMESWIHHMEEDGRSNANECSNDMWETRIKQTHDLATTLQSQLSDLTARVADIDVSLTTAVRRQDVIDRATTQWEGLASRIDTLDIRVAQAEGETEIEQLREQLRDAVEIILGLQQGVENVVTDSDDVEDGEEEEEKEEEEEEEEREGIPGKDCYADMHAKLMNTIDTMMRNKMEAESCMEDMEDSFTIKVETLQRQLILSCESTDREMSSLRHSMGEQLLQLRQQILGLTASGTSEATPHENDDLANSVSHQLNALREDLDTKVQSVEKRLDEHLRSYVECMEEDGRGLDVRDLVSRVAALEGEAHRLTTEATEHFISVLAEEVSELSCGVHRVEEKIGLSLPRRGQDVERTREKAQRLSHFLAYNKTGSRRPIEPYSDPPPQRHSAQLTPGPQMLRFESEDRPL